MWEKMTNLEERLKWDDRWANGSLILGDHEGGTAMFMQMPKPPVPMVAARESTVTQWKIEDFGEGQRASLARSTTYEHTHSKKDNQVADLRVMGGIIEAEGEGCKLTEIRNIDFGGDLFNAIVNKITSMIPVKNFEAWNKAFP